MAIPAGQRDQLITVQAATTTSDDHGGETLAWADVAKAWARVRFGTGQERREAAQEGGVQPATFEILPTAALLGVSIGARIVFDGSNWDITDIARLNRDTLRFTAVRSR